MYAAEIWVNGRMVAAVKDDDSGDLESKITAIIRDINAAQNAANNYQEVRVRYV